MRRRSIPVSKFVPFPCKLQTRAFALLPTPRSSYRTVHDTSPSQSAASRTGSSTTTTSSSSSVQGPLAGKKVLITGASRGIGAAIAERFAKEGARCVLVGRNEEKLREVRERLRLLGGEEHVVRAGDVGSVEFWNEVARKEKAIEILVNSAGITHYSPLFVTSVGSLEKIIETNLMGTMLACKVVGKGMIGNKAHRGGCIINIASLLGLKGGKGSVGYAASKAGVIGLTRSLAAEIGKANIRVNVIVPGYIESDMTAAMTPEARSEAINAIPLRRFGETSDVADAAVFLATNRYANNCVLNLDGGLSAT